MQYNDISANYPINLANVEGVNWNSEMMPMKDVGNTNGTHRQYMYNVLGVVLKESIIKLWDKRVLTEQT